MKFHSLSNSRHRISELSTPEVFAPLPVCFPFCIFWDIGNCNFQNKTDWSDIQYRQIIKEIDEAWESNLGLWSTYFAVYYNSTMKHYKAKLIICWSENRAIYAELGSAIISNWMYEHRKMGGYSWNSKISLIALVKCQANVLTVNTCMPFASVTRLDIFKRLWMLHSMKRGRLV